MNKRISIEGYWVDNGVEFTADCMIGKYDGVSDDDDIFFWFENEQEVKDHMKDGGIIGKSMPEFLIKNWEYSE